MQQQHDERLWRLAKKRASFRKSLFSYIVICSFFWAIWWITTGRHGASQAYPWPVWIMLGWGIALGFQYFAAYNGTRQDMAEQEYEKLKREQQ
ncbi:2TM domain-containing protein [Foetidibacter luteolus]|uniref:2TM domain-containing protein n=1 Tax=Foetidibacter luteolus TaxID=2608880 RepID=UPI00129A2AAB|nr:2TM domain-containing protein [Foetidibacter luteolus]